MSSEVFSALEKNPVMYMLSKGCAAHPVWGNSQLQNKWLFGALGLFSISTCHFSLENFFPLKGDCFYNRQLAGGIRELQAAERSQIKIQK